MYCPRCSQQQVSDDVSFCTRCGFQLGGVKELLVGGGSAAREQIIPPSGQRRLGRRGIRLGVKLMFFSLMLLPIFFAFSFAFDSPVPLIPPALIFLAGLTSVLYSWIFGEEIIPSKQKTAATLAGVNADLSALPPPSLSFRPLGDLRAASVNTAEIIHPPSVTEGTTNLLERVTE
jgi:hypothetical protein